MARAEMVGRYGSEAYTEGYKVITTVRSDLQNAASQSVRDGLIDYDQRHGYRGPETRLPGQTRDAWLKHLGQQRSIGGLEPAIVTQVEKSGIMVMTRDGKEEAVTWDSMKWARPSSATTAWARCRASPPTWPRPATRSACSARKTAPCASYRLPPHRAR